MTSRYPAIFIILVILAILAAGKTADAWPGQAANPAPDSRIVSRITIEITGSPDQTENLRALASRMIVLREGEPFSEEKLRKSLDILRDSRVFQEIAVPDPDWGDDQLALTFRLTPFIRIREIRFSGIFPILEREVERAMNTRSGQVFRENRVPEMKSSVISLFQSQGYLDPQVDISVLKSGKDDFVDLSVKVKKGKYYRIGNFEIRGNSSFSDLRLKIKSESWFKSLFWGEIEKFNDQSLENDINDLLQFYRSKGFPEVKITPSIEKDPEKAVASIILLVEEGPRYEISFQGNTRYQAGKMLKNDFSFDYGNENDSGLNRSIRNIRERYLRDGYLQSSAEARDDAPNTSGGKRREITISIEEGPRSIIRGINVEGNEAFDDKTILAQVRTSPPGFIHDGEYNPERLENDLNAIRFLYLRNGYRSASVESSVSWDQPENADAGDVENGVLPERRHGILTFTIDEGPQTRVGTVSVQGVSSLPVSELLNEIEMREGIPFQDHQLTNSKNTIIARISEQGYPYVEVTATFTLNDQGRRADVLFQVSEGKQVYLSAVSFSGNFRTREDTLREELKIREGDPFSRRKILESLRNIRGMQAIRSAGFVVPAIDENLEEPVLLVEVEEEKPYWLGASIGHDTERRYFVSGEGGDRNLFGRNKDLRGTFELSQVGYHGDASYSDPRLFNSRISLATTVFAERREALNQRFGTRGYGISQVFNRRFLEDKLTVSAGLGLEKRRQFTFEGMVIPRSEEYLYESRNFFVATPSVVYNTTDSYTRPRRGFIGSLFFDYSRGQNGSLDNFFRYRLESRYYYSPYPRLTLAARGRYGFIDPYGSSPQVPADQLFYLGGTSTVRGYEENLLRFAEDGMASGGLESLLLNAEARLDLGMNLELTTFCDAGAIRRVEKPGGTDDFRSSAGLGLRYVTPIGAVGILYGWKINPLENEKAGNLHFSIGYTF